MLETEFLAIQLFDDDAGRLADSMAGADFLKSAIDVMGIVFGDLFYLVPIVTYVASSEQNE